MNIDLHISSCKTANCRFSISIVCTICKVGGHKDHCPELVWCRDSFIVHFISITFCLVCLCDCITLVYMPVSLRQSLTWPLNLKRKPLFCHLLNRINISLRPQSPHTVQLRHTVQPQLPFCHITMFVSFTVIWLSLQHTLLCTDLHTYWSSLDKMQFIKEAFITSLTFPTLSVCDKSREAKVKDVKEEQGHACITRLAPVLILVI